MFTMAYCYTKSMSNKKITSELVSFAMSSRVPALLPHSTVEEAKELLNTEKPDQYDSINYIYVVDEKNILQGVISIKELLRNKNKTVLSNIMKSNLITLSEHSHQKRAALLAVKNKLKAVPVIDKEGKLLGVITSDSILSILHKVHAEGLLYSTGIGNLRVDESGLISASVAEHLKARLPWLLVGLVGGIFAASIVSGFDVLIEKMILLAAFLPAVVYIGDAVGTQSQMILVTSMAIDKKLIINRYLWRELAISSSIGLIIGISAGIISQIFWGNLTLSYIVITSFLFTIIISALIGVILPLGFKKLKMDPSVGSGPIATVMCDILNILVYFTVATLFLGRI